jgi:hypothetical protein
MVAWMTTTENRALELAMRRGYLMCRRDQRTLSDQFAQCCAELGRPVVRVDRQGAQYQVTLQWHQSLTELTPDQQNSLRRILQEPQQAPGLLPIVFRYGAYSAFLPQEAAEELAGQLADWVLEQFDRV